jgi:hypothetical protein
MHQAGSDILEVPGPLQDCGSSLGISMSPGIWMWRIDFWKVCGPLCKMEIISPVADDYFLLSTDCGICM